MRDDHFTPNHVDEQIEQLAQSLFAEAQETDQDARLIQRLQHHYKMENQKDVLERAWERIEQRYEAPTLLPLTKDYIPYAKPQEPERSGQYSMSKRTGVVTPGGKPIPRWGILVAVMVAALAVGSLTVFITQAATHTGSPASTGGSSPVTPTSCQPLSTPGVGVRSTATASQPARCLKPTPTSPVTPAPTSPVIATATPMPTPVPTSTSPVKKPTSTPTPAPTATTMPIPAPTPTKAPTPKSPVIPTAAPTPAPHN